MAQFYLDTSPNQSRATGVLLLSMKRRVCADLRYSCLLLLQACHCTMMNEPACNHPCLQFVPPVAAGGAGAGSVGSTAPALRRPFKLPALRKPALLPSDCSVTDQVEQALPAAKDVQRQPEVQPAAPPAPSALPAPPATRMPGLQRRKRPAAALTALTESKAGNSAQAEAEAPRAEERGPPEAAPTSAAPTMLPASPPRMPPPAAEQGPVEQQPEQQSESASMKQPAAPLKPPAGWRCTRLPAVLIDSLPPPPAPAAMPPADKLLGESASGPLVHSIASVPDFSLDPRHHTQQSCPPFS